MDILHLPICKQKRKTNYKAMKCQEFSKMLPDLDKNTAALQAPHEDGKRILSGLHIKKNRNLAAEAKVKKGSTHWSNCLIHKTKTLAMN